MIEDLLPYNAIMGWGVKRGAGPASFANDAFDLSLDKVPISARDYKDKKESVGSREMRGINSPTTIWDLEHSIWEQVVAVAKLEAKRLMN